MQIANAATRLGDGLPLELEHKAEDSVRGGMLWSHIDHNPLTLTLIGGTNRIPVATGDGVDRALARLVGQRIGIFHNRLALVHEGIVDGVIKGVVGSHQV